MEEREYQAITQLKQVENIKLYQSLSLSLSLSHPLSLPPSFPPSLPNNDNYAIQKLV